MTARLKELEAENRQLKKMYAEERLKVDIAREVITKKVAPSRRKEAVRQVPAMCRNCR